MYMYHPCISKKHTVGSLFSGAGLGDLGLSWAGFEHSWLCEKDVYAQRILSMRFSGVPVYTDVERMYPLKITSPTILIGGFPCQPFSSAAHGQWIKEKDKKEHLVRMAEKLTPAIVIGENVNEKPVKEVASGLNGIGYRTTVFRLASDQLGADHKRNRWWVVAHPDLHSQFHRAVYAEASRVSEIRKNIWKRSDNSRAFRAIDGGSHRMDRLRCAGNGQDPYATFSIGRALQMTGYLG